MTAVAPELEIAIPAMIDRLSCMLWRVYTKCYIAIDFTSDGYGFNIALVSEIRFDAF